MPLPTLRLPIASTSSLNSWGSPCPSVGLVGIRFAAGSAAGRAGRGLCGILAGRILRLGGCEALPPLAGRPRRADEGHRNAVADQRTQKDRTRGRAPRRRHNVLARARRDRQGVRRQRGASRTASSPSSTRLIVPSRPRTAASSASPSGEGASSATRKRKPTTASLRWMSHGSHASNRFISTSRS